MPAARALLAAAIVVGLAAPAHAVEVVANWSWFETAAGWGTNPGKLLTVVGAAAPFWSGIGQPDGQQAFSNDGWDSTSDYWSIDVDTTSFKSITVSSKHYAYVDPGTSETSPAHWKMQYECGGGWTDSGGHGRRPAERVGLDRQCRAPRGVQRARQRQDPVDAEGHRRHRWRNHQRRVQLLDGRDLRQRHPRSAAADGHHPEQHGDHEQ